VPNRSVTIRSFPPYFVVWQAKKVMLTAPEELEKWDASRFATLSTLHVKTLSATQVCVNLTQVCVNLTQVCVNLTQVCVNSWPPSPARSWRRCRRTAWRRSRPRR
jgi:hypothetical protein